MFAAMHDRDCCETESAEDLAARLAEDDAGAEPWHGGASYWAAAYAVALRYTCPARFEDELTPAGRRERVARLVRAGAAIPQPEASIWDA